MLSTESTKLAGMPVRKLAPRFVGPFTIEVLKGRNSVVIKYSERLELLRPEINLKYLRPHRAREKLMTRRNHDLAPVMVSPPPQVPLEIEEVIDPVRH